MATGIEDQIEINNRVCVCGHTHGQHVYDSRTRTARCQVRISGKRFDAQGFCPCERCRHSVEE